MPSIDPVLLAPALDALLPARADKDSEIGALRRRISRIEARLSNQRKERQAKLKARMKELYNAAVAADLNNRALWQSEIGDLKRRIKSREMYLSTRIRREIEQGKIDLAAILESNKNDNDNENKKEDVGTGN